MFGGLETMKVLRPMNLATVQKHLRRWRGFWEELTRDKVAVVSLAVVLLIVFLALFASFLPIPDPRALIHTQYVSPGAEHLMGTDNLGRSVLSRVIFGARLGLGVGLVSTGISMTLGIILGAISGYFGGWVDDVLSRIFDIFLLIPSFFLALLMVAIFGPNIYFIMFVIGITMWPRSARVMRAQVLTLKSRTYVQAVRVSGASHLQALFQHVIPNGIAPVITHGTILMGSAILIESGLSYLGLGDPNTVSWGRMINEAQQHLRVAPWMSIFPGLAMLVLVTALNLLGDGINYAVNPQLRERTARRNLALPSSDTPIDKRVWNESDDVVLDIRDLRMYYALDDDWVRSVDGVTLQLRKGESLGLVGESGCGKSSIGNTLMRVLPKNARVVGGSVLFENNEILNSSEESLRSIRWTHIAMIFQSAMNALNPVIPVGKQLISAYRLHRPNADRDEAQKRVEELFDIVGIPRDRINSFPHQLSGGMRQRVVICLALLLEPQIIVADEPTTALDVLVQDQILKELKRLQAEMHLSLILISHDVGVVAEMCDRIAVMYSGQIVEEASTDDIFFNSRHPYTRGLLGSLPTLTGPRTELVVLPGDSTALKGNQVGCRFASRCPLADHRCTQEDPPMIAITERHFSRCHYALDDRVTRAWTKQEELLS